MFNIISSSKNANYQKDEPEHLTLLKDIKTLIITPSQDYRNSQ